jgi:uncharacterized membrane protein
MSRYSVISYGFWTLLLLAAGVAHLLRPDFFMAYYPAYLPLARQAVLGTAFVEWLLAALLWAPRYCGRAWLGTALLMAAYLPVHLYVITHHTNIVHPTPAIPLWLAWVRLPVQFVFIAWAYGMWKRGG